MRPRVILSTLRTKPHGPRDDFVAKLARPVADRRTRR